MSAAPTSTPLGDGRTGRSRAPWLVALLRPVTVASLVVIVAVFGMAALGPMLVAGDPLQPDFAALLQGPSAKHWLGTDELGRDLLVRIVHGARPTLYAGAAAVLIGCSLGSTLGLLAGWYGGRVSAAIMTLVDVLLSFPYFLLVVLVVAILGPSLGSAMLAIGIWTAPYYARQIRANTLELKSRQFVEAAVVTGESDVGVILRHVLPNCTPQIVVLSSTYFSQAILLAAALSFLGLGAQPPAPEWGAMTAVGRENLFVAPHVLAVPAAFIFVTALAFNFLGDALREILDPRMRSA